MERDLVHRQSIFGVLGPGVHWNGAEQSETEPQVKSMSYSVSLVVPASKRLVMLVRLSRKREVCVQVLDFLESRMESYGPVHSPTHSYAYNSYATLFLPYHCNASIQQRCQGDVDNVVYRHCFAIKTSA